MKNYDFKWSIPFDAWRNKCVYRLCAFILKVTVTKIKIRLIISKSIEKRAYITWAIRKMSKF